jgi:hypothetical protein
MKSRTATLPLVDPSSGAGLKPDPAPFLGGLASPAAISSIPWTALLGGAPDVMDRIGKDGKGLVVLIGKLDGLASTGSLPLSTDEP